MSEKHMHVKNKLALTYKDTGISPSRRKIILKLVFAILQEVIPVSEDYQAEACLSHPLFSEIHPLIEKKGNQNTTIKGKTKAADNLLCINGKSLYILGWPFSVRLWTASSPRLPKSVIRIWLIRFIRIWLRQCIWADFCGFIPEVRTRRQIYQKKKHYVVEENLNVQL